MPPRAWALSVEMKRTRGWVVELKRSEQIWKQSDRFRRCPTFPVRLELFREQKPPAHYKFLKRIVEVIDLSEVKCQICHWNQDPCPLIFTSLAFPSLGAAGVP